MRLVQSVQTKTSTMTNLGSRRICMGSSRRLIQIRQETQKSLEWSPSLSIRLKWAFSANTLSSLKTQSSSSEMAKLLMISFCTLAIMATFSSSIRSRQAPPATNLLAAVNPLTFACKWWTRPRTLSVVSSLVRHQKVASLTESIPNQSSLTCWWRVDSWWESTLMFSIWIQFLPWLRAEMKNI